MHPCVVVYYRDTALCLCGEPHKRCFPLAAPKMAGVPPMSCCFPCGFWCLLGCFFGFSLKATFKKSSPQEKVNTRTPLSAPNPNECLVAQGPQIGLGLAAPESLGSPGDLGRAEQVLDLTPPKDATPPPKKKSEQHKKVPSKKDIPICLWCHSHKEMAETSWVWGWLKTTDHVVGYSESEEHHDHTG